MKTTRQGDPAEDPKRWARRVTVSLTRAQALDAATACILAADWLLKSARRRGVALRAADALLEASKR